MTQISEYEEQLATEIFETFISFFNFSLELINKIDKTNGYLKFAAVNMQISLELFLKFYFIKTGSLNLISVNKNGNLQFKDFSQILNYFFSLRKWSFGSKKELTILLNTRNSIVHKGINTGWNKDLAEYIVRCAFFIQGTLASNFAISVFEPNYSPKQPYSNRVWRDGVESFAEDYIARLYECDILPCPNCGALSLIPNEFLYFDEIMFNGLSCLCCFNLIETETSTELIDCYVCNKEAYLIDILNEQPHNEFVGYCLNCQTNTWVRKCSICKQYYHPTVEGLQRNGKYYCSSCCHDFDKGDTNDR